MANSYKFIGDHIELTTAPAKYKKLTATRFASIMGLNKWSTPFSAWCEITKTWEKPFEETIYTTAGKVIEPKICEYLRDRYFMDIKSPTDVYGPDYFRKTWGDFFPDVEALGGMWDFLGDDFVVEVKTTKRVEDWRGPNGKVEPPIYYKLQASLYAYLLGFDDVVMTCSFLTDDNYKDPEAFVPDVNNTVVFEFTVSEAFPTFKESYIDPALAFWKDHVLTGISPDYDEKKDAEILKALRTTTIDVPAPARKRKAKESVQEPPTIDFKASLADLIKESERLHVKTEKDAERLKKAEEKVAGYKADLKALEATDKQIREILAKQIQEGGKRSEVAGKRYSYVCTQTKGRLRITDDSLERMRKAGVYDKYVKEEITVKTKTDEKAMKADNVYETYAVKSEDTYSIKVTPIEPEN